jgi:hypothetical protein
MQDDGRPAQRAGFYVNCCVDASDAEAAGRLALDLLKAHPNLRLKSWPLDGESAPPPLNIDSIVRLAWWRRPYKRGISTGLVFYPRRMTRRASPSSEAARRPTMS